MIALLELQTLDYVLIAPGLVYIVAFLALGLAKGNAGSGYTLLGSKRAGNVLFLVMVSGMVFGAPALIAFVVGLVRLVLRVS